MSGNLVIGLLKDVVFPAALWHWGRQRLQEERVARLSRGG